MGELVRISCVERKHWNVSTRPQGHEQREDGEDEDCDDGWLNRNFRGISDCGYACKNKCTQAHTNNQRDNVQPPEIQTESYNHSSLNNRSTFVWLTCRSILWEFTVNIFFLHKGYFRMLKAKHFICIQGGQIFY